MSKDIAVDVVKQWHLSVCHDLCLPTIPIIVRNSVGAKARRGAAGRFVGSRTEEAAGFIALNFDGIIVGAPVGGGVTTKCGVEIHADPDCRAPDYLWTLAHELRHAWQFLNSVPATEEDCNQYADRFIERFSEPDCGRYNGLVDEKQYALLEYQEELQKKQRMKQYMVLAAFAVCFVVLLIGINSLNYTPEIGTGGRMFRTAADAAPAVRDARMKGWLMIAFSAVTAAVTLFVALRNSGPSPAMMRQSTSR